MKKTAALLILIGLVNAATASGQETVLTPTSPPTRGIGSALTPTAAPMLNGPALELPKSRKKTDQMPQAATGGMSPTTYPSSNQAPIPTASSSDNFVTLNFTNVDVSALVKVMSELTRRNFILDERITGKLTLMTPTKIAPDEAYQVFLSALEIKGFTAIEDGKIIRIIPTATARQSGLKVYQDNNIKGQGFVTKLIRMNFVNPQEIVRAITPLLTKDGNMIAYPTTNSIILTDSVSNIKKIESLIQAMDVAAPAGKGKINIYFLKNANAEDIAKMMQALVSRLPAASAAGAAQPAGPTTILEGTVTITADKSTNSLVIVGSPGDFETMKDVIQKLDIRRRQVYVEAAIIEMSLTKSLDIGFEFQYADRSINRTDTNRVTPLGGTNFGNIGTAMTGPVGLAAINGLVVAAVKGAFTYNGVQFMNISALIHALQGSGDVNVLSTPNLLTTDNQKAEIMVGSNIPFVTGQSQNAATGGTAILTSIDRKDVGITLKITPQITSDDSVRLDIYQEISDIITTPGLNVNIVGPSTSKRSASTTVVIKDRQTMVIGGLIRDNVTASTSAVPFLGDIPVLGWLFKTKSTSVDKTNLMIFITPYIIKNEFDAADMTNRKTDVQEKFRQEYRIEKKDYVSDLPKPAPAQQPAEDNKIDDALEKNQTQETIQSAPSTTIEKTDSALTSSPTITPANKEPGTMLQTAPTGTTGTTGTKESIPVPKSTVTYTPDAIGGSAAKSAPTTTTPIAPAEGVR